MNDFGCRVKNSIRIGPIGFHREQMEDIAQSAVDAEKHRMSLGINSNDQPAAPLNARYQTRKRNVGAAPIRDNRLTGQTLESFRVLSATNESATVGFNSQVAELRAERTQAIEPMIGLSSQDAEAPIKKAHEHFAENVQDCVVTK